MHIVANNQFDFHDLILKELSGSNPKIKGRKAFKSREAGMKDHFGIYIGKPKAFR